MYTGTDIMQARRMSCPQQHKAAYHWGVLTISPHITALNPKTKLSASRSKSGKDDAVAVPAGEHRGSPSPLVRLWTVQAGTA